MDKHTHTRINTNCRQGLSSGQVLDRKAEGLYNEQTVQATKSYQDIIKGNVFTLFNLINAILAGLIIFVGSYKNLLFLGVIISNIVIGIFQEVRAKRTLDKLSLITSTQIHVIRDGKDQAIHIEDLVLDDIMMLASGDQICSDAIVLEGRLEVNESLINGESDVITKEPGDFLYSGSFVISGNAATRVEHVGKENFAYTIMSDAKTMRRHPSQLRDAINYILKIISIIIFPLGILLFAKQYFISHFTMTQAIVSTTGAMIGMIPEGLVLLTSVALAVGTINLAKRKTLVQELYCIETLARVDTLCLDKTGTLTQGKMVLEEMVSLGEEPIEEILQNIGYYLKDDNSTFHAIREKCGVSSTYRMQETLPFSSVRKVSGVTFENHGTYILGAYEFMHVPKNPGLEKQIEQYAAGGSRVLTLAHSRQPIQNTDIPSDLEPIAFLLLSDPIRPETKDTLDYFKRQGVDLKIISGDNPITVQAIAQKAGLDNCTSIDASTLKVEDIEDAMKRYNVFGRVSPQQKKAMVLALQKDHHIVAMSGDGVNDVLALKEADCSIAVAGGSEAAKNVANLVLLDANFANLPHIVLEGRRVINNIQRAASLFLVKTTFSTVLALATLFLNSLYPFMPIQLTLISTLTIGIPSFFLALEPNHNRVKGNFLINVMSRAVPGAITVLACILAVNIFAAVFHYPEAVKSTLSVILTGVSGLCVLRRVCDPFTKKRALIFYSMMCLFIGCICLFPTIFSLVRLDLFTFLCLLGGIVAVPVFMDILHRFFNSFKKINAILENATK